MTTEPGTTLQRPPSVASHRQAELYRALRDSPLLATSIQRAAAGALEHFERWEDLQVYSKDLAAFAVASLAALFAFTAADMTAGKLKSVLVAGKICSARRAASMIAAMRRRGDLVEAGAEKASGRGQQLAIGPDLEAFATERLLVEVEALAALSPLGRSGLARVRAEPDVLRGLYIYVGSRLVAGIENPAPVPDLTLFFGARDFGTIFVYLLIDQSEDAMRGQPFAFSVSGAAKRLMVSRAHIRKLIVDAQAVGLLTWQPKEREMTLTDAFISDLRHSFANGLLTVAEGLSLLDGMPSLF